MSAIKGITGSNFPNISNVRVENKGIDNRDPRILEAAKGFENQFLNEMIKNLRKTTPGDNLFGDSFAQNVYKDQLDSEYSKSWVNNGGIGLTDIIYNQIATMQNPHSRGIQKTHTIPAPNDGNPKSMSDLFSKLDSNLFEGRKTSEGFDVRSLLSLEKSVGVRSPLSGMVLQSASLEDGRQMVVVSHDKGLVTQFVHNGSNRVKTGGQILAGQVMFELGPRSDGRPSELFLRLREAARSE